jgi:tetratricopeptide (TPR) repeat protein
MTSTALPRAPEHLDAESLAAFVDGRVSAEERAVMEAHLAGCEPCYEALVEVTRTLADVAAPVASAPVASLPSSIIAPPRRWNRTVVVILATAAVLILAVGFWWAQRPTPLQTALVALADAPREARFSPGRLSVDREWKPVAPLLRGPGGDAVSLEVRSAAQAVTNLTAADRTGAALHARGLALLAMGDLDAAIDALERATATEGADLATTRADLSAARLARFRQTGNPADAQRALEDADLALRANPRAAPALFNRAAALDALGDREKSTAAWQAVLDADPSSPWSAEARRRLSR